MPESARPVIEMIIGAGVALIALLGFRLREKKVINEELGVLHARVTRQDHSLHNFKEEVAKTYPSRSTMHEEMGALEKNIKTELKAHAAELKNIIRDEIDKVVSK